MDDDINFDYLGKLIKRIEHSKIREIRNNWLAHPFENKDNSLVFKSKHIQTSMLNSLGKICTKEDFPIYVQSNDRLKWFCERYLMKSTTTKENDHLKFQTSAMDIIKELYKLSNCIKIKKLYDIEPFFIVPEDQIHEFHLSPSRYIEDYNYKKFI
ncbi:hypothetical protein [Aeromonas enteropelogenes]|uniref:hypothetical protein n=1 Tax=Aeromonas enteropelogenes TaxID=29489 RepID=UPI003BA32DC1